MSTILYSSATHLSALRPQSPRYARIALQLLAKSAALLAEKVSRPVTVYNSEGLMGTAIMMQYISWSQLDFLEGHQQQQQQQQQFQCDDGSSSLDLSLDPLLRLSSGLKDVFAVALPTLFKSHIESVFLTASLYSPRLVIEWAIGQKGGDPERFVAPFMALWDDPRYNTAAAQIPRAAAAPSQAFQLYSVIFKDSTAPCCYCMKARVTSVTRIVKLLAYVVGKGSSPSEQEQTEPGADAGGCRHVKLQDAAASAALGSDDDPQRLSFLHIARSLSVQLCLLAESRVDAQPPTLAQLQPDIERLFFSFPAFSSACGFFRELLFTRDPRAMIALLHFYHAARVLLTSPGAWWARERSRVFEALILRDLKARGIEGCPWRGGMEGG